VIYHSPQTTLTIFRVSRAHYRTLWAATTLLRTLNGHPIVPRVVAVSGTIKKLQNRAIAYHRLVTAQMLSAVLAGMQEEGLSKGGLRQEKEKQMREGWGKEEEALGALDD
jgi:ribonuclease P/MRP protein subunit POP5